MLSAFRLTRINLYKALTTVNFWIPFILATAAVYEFTLPLANMAAYYSIPVNGFAISFLFTSDNATLIIFLGVFILFSELPFKDNQQMFMISRSGKRAWIFSQVFYVIVVSLIYFAFIFLCFCAVLLPNIGFSSVSYGKIIKTIAVADVMKDFSITLSIPQNVLTDFTPLEGFIFSFGVSYALAVVLGLLSLFFNLTVKRNLGTIILGALVFSLVFSHSHGTFIVYYILPINWCSISTVDKNGASPYPDISWIITVLGIWFVVEIIALFIFGNKKIKFVLDTKEEIT